MTPKYPSKPKNSLVLANEQCGYAYKAESSHPGESFWLNLIESGDTYMSGVLSNELSLLKKTGSKTGSGLAAKKERNRQNRHERKQRKKNRIGSKVDLTHTSESYQNSTILIILTFLKRIS